MYFFLIKDPDMLSKALKSRILGLKSTIKTNKISAYLNELQEAYEGVNGHNQDGFLRNDEINDIITRVNRRYEQTAYS